MAEATTCMRGSSFCEHTEYEHTSVLITTVVLLHDRGGDMRGSSFCERTEYEHTTSVLYTVVVLVVAALLDDLPLAQLMRIGGVGDPAASSNVRHRFRHTLESAWVVEDFHPPSSTSGLSKDMARMRRHLLLGNMRKQEQEGKNETNIEKLDATQLLVLLFDSSVLFTERKKEISGGGRKVEKDAYEKCGGIKRSRYCFVSRGCGAKAQSFFPDEVHS